MQETGFISVEHLPIQSAESKAQSRLTLLSYSAFSIKEIYSHEYFQKKESK